MYDVKKMKDSINNASAIAEKEVRDIFIKEFKSIYADDKIPTSFDKDLKISISTLSEPSDTKTILAGAGFYIIVTDLEIPENNCSLTFGEKLKAIYRGECVTVKKRILSHLFNETYKEEYEERKLRYTANITNAGKDFHEDFWPACLKIGDGTNGINIDKDYSKNTWYVVVHNMIGSSQQVRVQAELAFDAAFTKPIASRERT